MLSDAEFVVSSLIDNLFYLRTIREFCLNIELSFLNTNKEYIEQAKILGKICEELGQEAITLANGKISLEYLTSGIFFTKYTNDLETLTEKLFNLPLSPTLTEQELELKPSPAGVITNVDTNTVRKVEELNRGCILLSEKFIKMCEDIISKQRKNVLFSYSYPLLIKYMADEAKIYLNELKRLQKKNKIDPTFVSNYEYRYCDLFDKCALFVRGFSDPDQLEVVNEAHRFHLVFENLKNSYLNLTMSPDNQKELSKETDKQVKEFKNFISKIIEGILKSDLYFIVEPIFFDNLLTEINFFDLLLKNNGNAV